MFVGVKVTVITAAPAVGMVPAAGLYANVPATVELALSWVAPSTVPNVTDAGVGHRITGVWGGVGVGWGVGGGAGVKGVGGAVGTGVGVTVVKVGVVGAMTGTIGVGACAVGVIFVATGVATGDMGVGSWATSPVPERATLWGEDVALLITESCPVKTPTVVGLNSTAAYTDFPAGTSSGRADRTENAGESEEKLGHRADAEPVFLIVRSEMDGAPTRLGSTGLRVTVRYAVDIKLPLLLVLW